MAPHYPIHRIVETGKRKQNPDGKHGARYAVTERAHANGKARRP